MWLVLCTITRHPPGREQTFTLPCLLSVVIAFKHWKSDLKVVVQLVPDVQLTASACLRNVIVYLYMWRSWLCVHQGSSSRFVLSCGRVLARNTCGPGAAMGRQCFKASTIQCRSKLLDDYSSRSSEKLGSVFFDLIFLMWVILINEFIVAEALILLAVLVGMLSL